MDREGVPEIVDPHIVESGGLAGAPEHPLCLPVGPRVREHGVGRPASRRHPVRSEQLDQRVGERHVGAFSVPSPEAALMSATVHIRPRFGRIVDRLQSRFDVGAIIEGAHLRELAGAHS
jgi:hypothetical protein